MKWTLKGIRNNLNFTQEEMAKKLGISTKTYQDYEMYKNYPNVEVIYKLLELSKIDFNNIIFLPVNYAKNEN